MRRTAVPDRVMLDLRPLGDKYIEMGTGRNWAADTTIYPQAKSAARMLLTLWYENPGMIGQPGSLQWGLSAALTQLEAKALRWKNFEGRAGSGAISLAGAQVGDTVVAVTGLVGASGSQSANFETVITVDNEIQQVSTSDLTKKFFRAELSGLEER